MERRKRILVSLPYDSSTNKFDRYFPIPVNLLSMKRKEDIFFDLNLDSYKKPKIEILLILYNFLEYISKSKIKKIIVSCGDFPADGDKFFYFEYFLNKVDKSKKIELIGPYTLFKNRIRNLKKENIKIKRVFNPILNYITPIKLIKKYPRVGKKLKVNLNLTQGCIRRCNYCPTSFIYSGKYVKSDLEEVFQKITFYYENGVRFFNFIDDNISADKKYFKDFLKMLLDKNYEGAIFQSQEGFEVKTFLDNEICSLIKETNWTDIKIGVENINNDFLKSISKTHRGKDVFAAIKNIKENKLDVKVYYLIGKDSTEEEVMENYKFFSENNLNVRINILRSYKDNLKSENGDNPNLIKLRSLGYAIAWLSYEKKIDLFNTDKFEILKKLDIEVKKSKNKFIFSGKVYLGFMNTSKLIKILKFIFNIGDEYKNTTADKNQIVFFKNQDKILNQFLE